MSASARRPGERRDAAIESALQRGSPFSYLPTSRTRIPGIDEGGQSIAVKETQTNPTVPTMLEMVRTLHPYEPKPAQKASPPEKTE